MLKIIHGEGFFSCCSVILSDIILYFNQNHRLPDKVDSSDLFKLYKPYGETRDITYDYFYHYDLHNNFIEYTGYINYDWGWQFVVYTQLDLPRILPFVYKYFSPNKEILDIIENIENKYNLSDNYDNICVLFYRGNDKKRETTLCKYSDIIEKSIEILKDNPNVKFLIQSDETEFIEEFGLLYPNHIIFHDEIRHINKCDSTVDKVLSETNYKFSKYFLSIVIIMSKCKHIICGSGNISMWIVFFRGHMQNVHQYFNDKWVS
jgi:hypothetical protein